MSAFTLLDDVWNSCKDTLAATGLLALVVWVGSACLFYLFEKVIQSRVSFKGAMSGQGVCCRVSISQGVCCRGINQVKGCVAGASIKSTGV